MTKPEHKHNDSFNDPVDNGRKIGHASYEQKEVINRYLLRYWGERNDIWPSRYEGKFPKPGVDDFAQKCVNLVLEYTTAYGSLIDIGCAAGRTSFDLAKHFKQIVGIDYSHGLIKAANTLREKGEMTYRSKSAGSEQVDKKAIIDPQIDRTRLHFEQGDGSNIDPRYHNFDAVLHANVLCRLPDPEAGLLRLQGENGLVKPGGIVVMTTPFSWLEQYTPQAKWLNQGIEDVKAILSEFELLHTEDIPMLFREHSRKFEYVIPLASVWRRKEKAA